MVFEEVRLPHFVIADLYKDSLIALKDETAEKSLSDSDTNTEQLRFLGDNKKISP